MSAREFRRLALMYTFENWNYIFTAKKERKNTSFERLNVKGNVNLFYHIALGLKDIFPVSGIVKLKS